jgi:hypothetical protein
LIRESAREFAYRSRATRHYFYINNGTRERARTANEREKENSERASFLASAAILCPELAQKLKLYAP